MAFTPRTTRQTGRMAAQAQVTYHQPPMRTTPAPGQYQQSPQQQSQIQQQQQVHQPSQQQMQQQTMQEQQSSTAMYKILQQSSVAPKQEPNSNPSTGIPGIGTARNPSEPNAPQPATQGNQGQDGATDGSEANSRPWKKHKNVGFKVNKVQKRRRQNARFRKLLIPKNAMMILNELKPGVVFDSDEQTNAFSQVSYTVRVQIDDTTYTGEGTSKAAAKAAAAELAVKGLILQKIAESNLKKELALPAEEEAMDADIKDDSSDKGSVNGRRVIPEDEVPWGSLASFALFKLFADWKSQGNNIPHMVAPAPKPVAIPAAKPPGHPRPAVPDHPEQLHPVTLVGRLHPGTLFTELSREGNPPNMLFTMGITLSGQQYTGTARSKKEAKKQCAISALQALEIPYDINA